MKKHLTFKDRVVLEYYLETNPRGTIIEVAELLNKSRQAIYYELKHNTTHLTPSAVYFNKSVNVDECSLLKKFPFCCNSCGRTRCSIRSRMYNAEKANAKAHRSLVNSRVNTKHREKIITILDKTVSQLIIDGVSIPVAMLSVNNLDVSESTIRRYINSELLLARRYHLPNAVRFKVKKQYSYSKKGMDVKILYKRTYEDYCDYMAANPKAKVIQVDSLIGRANGSSALLTVFFLNSKFQLAIKYNRKASNINAILMNLYNIAKEEGFKLFDVVLADNGPEFANLSKIEKDEDQALRIKVFYCDPYRSCQKAECERNHGFIRRIFRKGKTFDNIPQNEFDVALSHINSYPRGSLNKRTPHDLFTSEYNSIIACRFNIDKVEIKDLRIIAK